MNAARHLPTLLEDPGPAPVPTPERDEPCYDTTVLARTLSWTDHCNPHWPMSGIHAARTARKLHSKCPDMSCATKIAAQIKIEMEARRCASL
ncbi:hypothetical protein [Nocardia sp. NPDC048505]|uniref:hypothetical protein n=1 Tax=unclassified Nocardia TaxID=2637762 RepID=UPI0033C1E1BB